MRVLWVLAAAFLVLPFTAIVYAADPQPYEVKFTDTPNGALNDMLKGTSELLGLRKTAPVGPFALIGRARTDIGRLQTVLQSFGYYQGSVAVTIDSLALDAAGLGDELSKKGPKEQAHVAVSFDLGPLYHLGSVQLTGEVPPSAAAALHLSSGAPAVAAQVLAAADRVRAALGEDGYAFAKVDPPHAKENSAQHVLNVTLHVAPGKRYRLGDIRLTGLKTTRDAYVRRRLTIHQGDWYRASAIEAARRDLLAAGIFTQVSVALDPTAKADDEVPVTFRFRERKPRTAGFTAAYSSDLGASAGVNWTKRNLTGNADSLALSANVLNLGGGSATTGVGYDLTGKYLVPDWKIRDQSLQVDAGALKQSLTAYDQTAVLGGVSVLRKLSQLWSVSAGFTAERERILQEAPPDAAESAALGCARNPAPPLVGTTEPRCTYDYTILGLPLTGTFNSTGLDTPLEDATHGLRASLALTPTFSLGKSATEFLITQLTASSYFDLNRLGLAAPGRSVLAFHALAGFAAGASQFDLPPDQRFYAGGSGTIRGYRYQSVGPEFADGNPIGGTAIDAGTIEFRQRVGTSLGFATFVDAGNVSRTLDPFSGAVKIGVGAGVRYYTALGPLRVDVAVPIERRSGKGVANPDEAFQVYIGLGQAF